MTSDQVVETSVTNNSSFQNYTQPDDHTIRTTDTPGFKPFTLCCESLFGCLLRRRANAQNVSCRISLRWPIHIINHCISLAVYCLYTLFGLVRSGSCRSYVGSASRKQLFRGKVVLRTWKSLRDKCQKLISIR